MLVKCKKSFRHQLKEGNIYLVVEIIIKRKSNTIRYRLIDNEDILQFMRQICLKFKQMY